VWWVTSAGAAWPRALAIAIAILGSSSAAGAEPRGPAGPPSLQPTDAAVAREAFEAARRAYNVGKWRDATEGFEKAYRLSGDPALLFDLAQAHWKAGNLAEASVAYRAFVRELPGSPSRGIAEARLQEIQKKLEAAPPTEAPPPPRAKPAAKPAVAAIVEPVPVHQDEPAPSKTGGLPSWLPLVGLGTTVVLAGGAAAVGLSTRSRFNDLRDSCGRTSAGCPDSQIDSVKQRARITNVLLVLAGLSAAATGVAFYAGPRESGVSVARRF
jgi:hypothetical protein